MNHPCHPHPGEEGPLQGHLHLLEEENHHLSHHHHLKGEEIWKILLLHPGEECHLNRHPLKRGVSLLRLEGVRDHLGPL